MATSFNCTIKESAGAGVDFTSVVSWEAAIDSDLTTTRVMSHSGINGAVAAGNTIVGNTSTATGTVIFCTAAQIHYTPVTGTFQSGEQVYVLINVNYVNSTSSPDSVIAKCIVDGTWTNAVNSALTVSGWTTGASNYIDIYTTASCRQPGYYSNSSPYYRQVGNAGGAGFQVQIEVSYVRMTGFIVYNNYSVDTADRGLNFIDGVTNTLLSKMIIMGHGVALRNYNFSAGGTARNTVILSTDNLAVYTGLASFIFQNCVAVASGGTGGAFGAGSQCTNCYAHSAGGAGYADGTPTTSASSDGSRSTTTVAYSTSSGAYFTNVTATTEDFHITTTAGALDGAGTADIFSPWEDIDGDARTAGQADIGVDYISGGAAPATGFMTTNTGYWGGIASFLLAVSLLFTGCTIYTGKSYQFTWTHFDNVEAGQYSYLCNCEDKPVPADNPWGCYLNCETTRLN